MGNCFKKQRSSGKIPTKTKLQDNVPMEKGHSVSQTLRHRHRIAPKLGDLNENKLYRSRISTRESASTFSILSFT